MPDYIIDPLGEDENNEERLEQEAYDFLQSRWPDWEPADSNLEAWLVAACSRMVAEAEDLARDVPPAIFRYYGATVLGINPVEATHATVDSTWTLDSNPAGRTIEEGTLVGITGEGGESVTFEVAADVALAAGVMATGAGAVPLRAVEPGVDGTGLGGAGQPVELIDALAWVAGITLTGATTGGTDEEDDDAYLSRLSARLTLLTPRPILPRDFELLAADIASQNGVSARTLALDGYNPGDGTLNNERMVHIVMVDDTTGANVPGGIKTAVDAGLQEQREVNFIVTVGDPTRNTVGFTYAAVAHAGFDPATVEAAADAALAGFASPVYWGNPLGIEERAWRNKTVVRYQDALTVLNNVEGLDYVSSLLIHLNGDGGQANDRNLIGAAPVVDPGVISGSVTV
jgi:Baseplate J-like protein